MIDRPPLLDTLTDRILSCTLPHPARVAVDGVDTAGKTHLADELSAVLRERGQNVLRATVDRFHNPRAVRYRLGPDSPEGYYADSFDLAALRRVLLNPLGPGGDRRVQLEWFDFRSDRHIDSPVVEAAPDSILLFDGVFLQRPELSNAWDLVVYVKVSYETVIQRAVVRDADLLGGPEAAEARYRVRYLPAQQHYLSACSPEERADLVIVNDNPERPVLVLH